MPYSRWRQICSRLKVDLQFQVEHAESEANNMATDRIIDRSLLHFPEEVKHRFAYLEGLGFRDVRTEPTFVRYESPATAINIYQGRQSYEIGLEIESSQAPTESYSFSEVLRLLDAERAVGPHVSRSQQAISTPHHDPRRLRRSRSSIYTSTPPAF